MALDREPLSNAFAQQPKDVIQNTQQLTSPEMATDEMVGMRAPSGQAPAPNAAPAEIVPAEAEAEADIGTEPDFFKAALGAIATHTIPSDDINAPLSTKADPTGLASAAEQLDEMWGRLKVGWATKDPEAIEAANESFGVFTGKKLFDNVRIGDTGDLEVIRSGSGEWTKLDRNSWELIGDIMNNSRFIAEAIIENSVRAWEAAKGGMAGGIGGAALGAGIGAAAGLAGGPAAPATVPVGATAGAASMGAMGAMGGAALGWMKSAPGAAVTALEVTDLIQEKFLGISRDPSRNRYWEAATTAAIASTSNWVEGKTTAYLRQSLARQKTAKETMEFATEQMNLAAQEIRQLEESGIQLVTEDGVKFKLNPSQILLNQVGDINALNKDVSGLPAVENAIRNQGIVLLNAYDSYIKGFKSIIGRGSDMSSVLAEKAKAIKNAEGKLIGSFRALVDEKAAKRLMPVQKTQKAFKEMVTEMGGEFAEVPGKGGFPVENMVLPDAKTLGRRFGMSPKAAKNFAEQMTEIHDEFVRNGGNMNVDDISRFYKELRDQVDAGYSSSNNNIKAMATLLNNVKKAARDDYTGIMGEVLGERHKARYVKAMAKYGQFKDAETQVRNLLKNAEGGMSKMALVDQLFMGSASPQKVKAIRTIIQEDDPQLWQDLGHEAFKRFKFKFGKPDANTGAVDWTAMAQKWVNETDPEMRKIMSDAIGIDEKGMTALLKMGARVDATTFKSMGDKGKQGVIRNLFKLMGNTMAPAKGDALEGLIESLGGKDQIVTMWLKEGGMEDVLKQMPHLKPDTAARWREWIADWVPREARMKLKAAGQSTSGRAAKEVFKGTTRTGVRKGTEEFVQ